MENPSVKWGLIGGIGAVVITLILFIINSESIFGKLSFVSFLVYIIAMVKAGAEEKQNLGGFMTWGEALKPTFLSYAIATLIASIFMFVLGNFIDPSLNEIVQNKSIEIAEVFSSYIPEEEMEANVSKIQATDFFSVFEIGKQYFVGLIFPGFIIAAIISAIVKKNRPEMA